MVEQGDVDEGIRLMIASKSSLWEERPSDPRKDPLSSIYDIIRNAARLVLLL